MIQPDDWERIGRSKNGQLNRLAVPGGWLVCVFYDENTDGAAETITFYPDPEHKWNP